MFFNMAYFFKYYMKLKPISQVICKNIEWNIAKIYLLSF
jgi:hypothetical protein